MQGAEPMRRLCAAARLGNADAAAPKSNETVKNLTTTQSQVGAATSVLRGVARLHVDESRFDWSQPYNKNKTATSVGSAAVIDADKEWFYLLTAFHVVRHAVRVQCSFSSLGRVLFDAEMLGACPEVDAALLRVSRKALPLQDVQDAVTVILLGNSDAVSVNDDVRALGFPQGEHSPWSTKGVIAGRLADTGQFQIDASINPGNSGGPLIDANERLIGIVVARHSFGEGMGYATPIEQVRLRLTRMKSAIVVKPSQGDALVLLPSFNARLGVATTTTLESLGADPKQVSGAFVAYVLPDTPLHRAGIRKGDVLTRLGCPVDNYAQVLVDFWDERLHVDALLRRAQLGTQLRIEWWSAAKQRAEGANVLLDAPDLMGMRERYPPRDSVDYETFAGVVVMELTLNHLQKLSEVRKRLVYAFEDPKLYARPPLIVTHLMSGSSFSGQPLIQPPDRLVKVNNIKVRTLDDYRSALLKPIRAGSKLFLRLESKDGTVSVIDYARALGETLAFAKQLVFQPSDVTLQIQRMLVDARPSPTKAPKVGQLLQSGAAQQSLSPEFVAGDTRPTDHRGLGNQY